MKIKPCELIKPDFAQVEQYLEKSYELGQLSNSGPCFFQLRDRLVPRLGIEFPRTVVPVASGHVALMAAYAALDIKRPLMPAYTFPSTYCAATLQGIEPQLVDVDQYSGCLEVEDIEDIPKDSYDSVVLVCALSNVPQLEYMADFCKKYDKKLIIDGAATFGTPGVAKFGDAYCMSLHATKSFPAGEGGLVITDIETAHKVHRYIEFGMDSHKQITMPGLNGKISEYAAAISLSVLDQIDPYIEKRLLNYYYFKQKIEHSSNWRTLTSTSNTSINNNVVFQFAPVFANKPGLRARAARKLGEKGVPCLQYYRPLQRLKNTAWLYETNVCVPIHSGVSKTNIDQIVDILTHA